MYVAPPMRMGAWSMARVLRQRIEYYLQPRKSPSDQSLAASVNHTAYYPSTYNIIIYFAFNQTESPAAEV